MSPAEHYAKAEELAAFADQIVNGSGHMSTASALAAIGQIHATLATAKHYTYEHAAEATR